MMEDEENGTASIGNLEGNQPPQMNSTDSVPTTSKSNITRRVKRKRRFSSDMVGDEFTSTVKDIGCWIEKASDNLSMLASCFQHLANDAEAKKQTYAEVKKLVGFSPRDKIKVGSIISREADKVNYFFQLSDEEKVEYVQMLLEGDE